MVGPIAVKGNIDRYLVSDQRGVIFVGSFRSFVRPSIRRSSSSTVHKNVITQRTFLASFTFSNIVCHSSPVTDHLTSLSELLAAAEGFEAAAIIT